MTKKTNITLSGTVIALAIISTFVWQVNNSTDSEITQTMNNAEQTKTGKPEHVDPLDPSTRKNNKAILQVATPDVVNEPPSSLSILEELFPSGDSAWTWAKVDLDSIRQDIPNNLYWTHGAPTTDQNVLDLRKESKTHWEEQYGKVLSNTATEQEIRQYYEHQYAISTDYVEFTSQLISRYGKNILKQDYDMQTLARNMHLAKLEEIPRKLARALEHKQHFETQRNTWLADKESYEANLAMEKEAALRALGKI